MVVVIVEVVVGGASSSEHGSAVGQPGGMSWRRLKLVISGSSNDSVMCNLILLRWFILHKHRFL